jgi:hypothetical protein
VSAALGVVAAAGRVIVVIFDESSSRMMMMKCVCESERLADTDRQQQTVIREGFFFDSCDTGRRGSYLKDG